MPDFATAKLKLLPRIELHGQVADSGCFMDECAVVALPVFLRGGVPLKLVEAMARGKAIVASPQLVSGVDITDGENALIRTKPEDFASAIVLLLRNTPLREQLGRNARATFERDFSLSTAEATLRRDSVLMQRVSSASHRKDLIPQ